MQRRVPVGSGLSEAPRADSLGVLLVDGAVDPNSRAQPVHALILLDAPQHGRQCGSAQAG